MSARSSFFANVALRVLAVAFVVVFAGLVYNNYRLRARLAGLEQALRRAQRQMSSRVVRAGERFESLRVLDVSGRARMLETHRREAGALVAVVNPECDSCEAVTAEIRDYVRSGAARPVWLMSMSDAETTRAFAARHGLEGVTFRLPDDANPFVRQRLTRVPQVFVVDAHERVSRACESVSACAAGPETETAAVASSVQPAAH